MTILLSIFVTNSSHFPCFSWNLTNPTIIKPKFYCGIEAHLSSCLIVVEVQGGEWCVAVLSGIQHSLSKLSTFL